MCIRDRWYSEAMALTRSIPELFSDPDGGFFTTAVDGESLIVRPKDLFDNPAPSGNSLAAEALLLASAYSGDQGLSDLAEATVRTASTIIERAPTGGGHMLAVLTAILDGPQELAVVGPL